MFRSRAVLELEKFGSAPPNRRAAALCEKTLQLAASGPPVVVWLSRIWSDWRSALAIVKPETVTIWHRASFSPVLDLEGAARPTFGPYTQIILELTTTARIVQVDKSRAETNSEKPKEALRK